MLVSQTEKERSCVMYIFKNAIKNLGRNKGRNLLMGVIIFAIIFTTSISIIINTTTGDIIKDYKARFGSEATIAFDTSKIKSLSNRNEPFTAVTPQQYIDFGKSKLLKDSYFTAQLMAVGDNLKALDENEGSGALSIGGAAPIGGSEVEKMVTPNVKLISYSKPEMNEDFKKGIRKIIDGKFGGELYDCIISEEFAKLNSLKVGDKIKVKSIYEKDKMTEEFTISGIYSDDTSLGNEQTFKMAMLNRGNEIIMNADTITKLAMFKKTGSVSATYILKEPSLLSAYEAELKEMGLPEYYKVSTDEIGYKKVVGPVEGLAKVSLTFMIVVLALGAVILIFLSTLAMRERKYEIGVLRAMGMKKGKVARGLIYEMLIITSLCVVLGIGTGAAFSQTTANSLLKNQVAIAEQTEKNGLQPATGGITLSSAPLTLGGSADEKTKPLSELKVSLNFEEVYKIILVALLLAGVSSIAGILYTTKYEPMKILSERN